MIETIEELRCSDSNSKSDEVIQQYRTTLTELNVKRQVETAVLHSQLTAAEEALRVAAAGQSQVLYPSISKL